MAPDDVATVRLREKDLEVLIGVLRFHTGEITALDNVFDEDVEFLIDTFIEELGRDPWSHLDLYPGDDR